MRDPNHTKLAAVLVHHSVAVRPGDLVTIVGEPSCMPVVQALFEAVLGAGGHPSFHPRSEVFQELLLRHGSQEQLRHVSPFERNRLEHCDVLIVLRSPLNTRVLSGVDPGRIAAVQAARGELMAMSMKRSAVGAMRYVLVEVPSNAAAQDAERSLQAYSEWVYAAGMLDRPDPVMAWRAVREKQARVCGYLGGKRTLRIQSPPSVGTGGRTYEGTDLTIDVAGRTWMNASGEENFPDGEVYSGPASVDGVFSATFPAVYQGQAVEGVRLRFEGGRVVEASASKNEAFLLAMLDQDDGARTAGEIGIGTNYGIAEFMRNAFFDEKIGGTFHLALGAGYPQTGNTNESGLHWDIVSDLRPSGTIHADGELIQRDGKFVFPGWPGC